MPVKTAPPSYRVSSTPDTGLGVFATRPIALGELIIAEKPLFICSPSDADIKRKVANLSATDKAIFFGLTDNVNPTNPTAVSICRTNALPLGKNPTHAGIYEICCRFNHSCLPNAMYAWNHDDGREVVHAITNISSGTEIVVQYHNTDLSRSDRQALFLSSYNSTCKCTLCTGPVDPVSDARRERIQQLRIVGFPYSALNLKRAIRDFNLRLRLMDEEGMTELSQRLITRDDGVELCVAVSNFEQAKRHAGLCYAYLLLCEGRGTETTEKALRTYRNPRIYPGAGSMRHFLLPTYCDQCGAESSCEFQGEGCDGGVCDDCHCAIYCSKACKKAHRARHKAVCDVIKMDHEVLEGKFVEGMPGRSYMMLLEEGWGVDYAGRKL